MCCSKEHYPPLVGAWPSDEMACHIHVEGQTWMARDMRPGEYVPNCADDCLHIRLPGGWFACCQAYSDSKQIWIKFKASRLPGRVISEEDARWRIWSAPLPDIDYPHDYVLKARERLVIALCEGADISDTELVSSILGEGFSLSEPGAYVPSQLYYEPPQLDYDEWLKGNPFIAKPETMLALAKGFRLEE